jgi:hypothetical protein
MYSKIIIGIDESSNITQLLSDGIRQFYFGYIPQTYLKTYSTQTSLNRRYRAKEQFTSLALLEKAIEQIHLQKGIVYLALNAFTSNAVMLRYAQELYDVFAHKVDGIIVANIAMASMLKKYHYPHIIISNLFGVYTPQSVAFLQKQFNPTKIILPRDISLEAIETIVTSYPKQAFECFLYGDNCRYSESFCFTEHGYDSTSFGSLCSFATKEKQLIKAALPTFKHTVKSSKMTDDEKKERLQIHPLDVASLLDACQVALYENRADILSQTLDVLERYDVQNFRTSKTLYVRALSIMKNIDTPKAYKIHQALEASPYKAEDDYGHFHKLNANAIAQTIRFLSKFDNIVSYKIPSRGRDFYKYLFSGNEKEPYNYKESQYRL